ncbi:hypothetical protein C0Q70_04610 [Pomacea canaliculata]|uniref:Cytochrome P450 CYP302A1 n=2 Tax=Pomacea canaliculata TaxID=400727 RepID=A0A2T7PIU6_POMCA|nr:hypothetical protein C0Q70_04610 [Pomacea canaliculata]
MERLRDTYGPIIRERVLLNFQLVHVFRPEDIETVYRLEGARPRREGFRLLQKYNNKYNDGVQGIITSQGEVWHRLRSKTQGRLLKPKSVAAYLNIHNGVADDLVASIGRLRNTEGIIEDFLPELYKFAMEGIGFVCFNRRVGALDENIPADSDTFRFIEAVNDVMTVSHSENKSFFVSEWSSEFKKLRRAQTFIKEMSTRQALQTLEMMSTNELQLDAEGGDLIRYLMTKTDLSQAEVLTVISEFFFAGVDTTSHVLGFALYALAQNPEVQEKLIEEIDRVTDGSDVISSDMIGRMPYLKAVAKETFRVTPITPGNGRTLDNDIVLSGYHVPAGIMFGLHHDVACKSPQYVSEPDRFLPERWLRGGSGDLGTIHPFVLMPFGFGPRSCVGRRLAEQEYSLGLIKILQKFRVEYAHNELLNYTMSIINTPTTPLKFRFLERK